MLTLKLTDILRGDIDPQREITSEGANRRDAVLLGEGGSRSGSIICSEISRRVPWECTRVAVSTHGRSSSCAVCTLCTRPGFATFHDQVISCLSYKAFVKGEPRSTICTRDMPQNQVFESQKPL